MTARLSCWDFLLRALGSQGGVLNKEGMASYEEVGNILLGPCGGQSGRDQMEARGPGRRLRPWPRWERAWE